MESTTSANRCPRHMGPQYAQPLYAWAWTMTGRVANIHYASVINEQNAIFFQCPKHRNNLAVAPNIRNIPNYNSFKLDVKSNMLPCSYMIA